MNVIIANKNQLLLENLGIDIIKEMNGEFDVDEIISTFQNFFYQRMILDITAIKNYTNITNLQKLSISLDMEKVILLLDGTEQTTNPKFLSDLVSMGIYNFAKDVEGIQYLYNTPNSYRDVAHLHQIGNVGMQATSPTGQVYNQPNPQAQYIAPMESTSSTSDFSGTRIIGVKNVTKQSGASTLIYMMKKELSKNYSVAAIEVDKSDFSYFREKDMISTTTSDIGAIINKNKDKNVILIDVNNSKVAEGYCQEILYLIEPSIIKLQKLMAVNAPALMNLRDKKVVLNQSLLSESEISDFEYESRLKVFYNLVPLNERNKKLPEINKLLLKLGFTKQ